MLQVQNSFNERIPVILGPTGSGKTALISILNGTEYEVISCDSRQVYRELTIGTAAPSVDTVQKVAHHLVGFLSPESKMTAALFLEKAKQAIADVRSRSKKPIIVGGTGFYFRALRTGLFDVKTDPAMESYVNSLNRAERLSILQQNDPEALQPVGKIHPNDDYRVSRALIVSLSGSKTWSELWQESIEKQSRSSDGPYYGWVLNPEIESWRAGLGSRVEKMLTAGLVEETESVYEKYGDCPGLQTLGYADVLEYIHGRLSKQEMLYRITVSHAQYGKRQRTWMRKEPLEAIRPEKLEKIIQNL